VIARRLGYDTRRSAFSALLFPTLTIVALESVTTQNDLVEASFVAAAVALALGRTRAETVLAGLALGLAAGTKLTFLYAIPAHVAGAAKRVFTTLHIPPNPPESTATGTFAFTYEPNSAVSEDSSALGPLGFLLLVPLSLGFLVAWALRRADRVSGAFALALP